jgi:ADP-dependent NAD(P)H-hydrate dehydratase / NAD(P)H-hydrate epimerase
MRAIEENSEELGVKRLLLMENAGRAVARETVRNSKDKTSTVLIVAYNGNKAGDAFVAARHLASEVGSVEILMVASPVEIRTDEARANWKIVQNLENRVKIFTTQQSKEIANFFAKRSPSIVIDGLLGTGLKGDLREPLLTAVREINKLKDSAFIIAIDLPTGLDPDTGVIHGDAVQAHLTVTHHRYKLGLLAKGAKQFTGKIVLAEIGIPPEAELFTGPGDLRKAVKHRSVYAHKGDSGRVLVVAGSKRYSGSAVLCGLAALRTGVDLVTILAPDSIANVIRSYSPDLIVRSFLGEYFGPRAISAFKEYLPNINALAIGPGLGLAPETARAVGDCLLLCRKLKIPTVIDADGIKALRGKPERIRGLQAVLTPHAGEFKILTGEELPMEQAEESDKRSAIIIRWAKKLKATILVKGHQDIISNGVSTRLSRGGNPGMTVGGTGDVLTGIVAAFLASGNSGFDSACAGSYLNKAVGDYVASFKGHHLLASDLVEALPKILVKFDASSD